MSKNLHVSTINFNSDIFLPQKSVSPKQSMTFRLCKKPVANKKLKYNFKKTLQKSKRHSEILQRQTVQDQTQKVQKQQRISLRGGKINRLLTFDRRNYSAMSHKKDNKSIDICQQQPKQTIKKVSKDQVPQLSENLQHNKQKKSLLKYKNANNQSFIKISEKFKEFLDETQIDNSLHSPSKSQKKTINPYTKKPYIYAHNECIDKIIQKRAIQNAKRAKATTTTINKSCKIKSIELAKPTLRRYKDYLLNKQTEENNGVYLDLRDQNIKQIFYQDWQKVNLVKMMPNRRKSSSRVYSRNATKIKRPQTAILKAQQMYPSPWASNQQDALDN